MPYETNRENVNNEQVKLKQEYSALLIKLNNRLGQAEEYGKNSDDRMISELDRMNLQQQNVEDCAEETGEPLPDKNFTEEAERIMKQYLPNVIQKEINRVKELLDRDSEMSLDEKAEFYRDKGGGYPGDGQIKIVHIEEYLDYYSRIYPDIGLQDLKPQLEELKKIIYKK